MLLPGSHHVIVRGIDHLGNIGPPARSDFMVIPASQVTIVFPGEGDTTGPSGMVTYDIGDAVTLECSLDEKPAICPLGGNFGFSDLPGGSHTFAISGKNEFGDQGPVDTLSWKVDVIGPSVHIDRPSDDRAGGSGFTCSSGSITFDCAEDCPPASFECSLDGGGFDECNGGMVSFSNLSAGDHSIKVHAIDAFGNIGEDDRETWTVANTRLCKGGDF
jgi:hypothetical protein